MIRVVVASDIRIYREGIGEILDRSGTIMSVGEAPDAKVACALVAQLAPDVLLLDLALPGSRNIIVSLGQGASPTRVVALGVAEEPLAVGACAEAGVAGFVPRSAGVDDLVAAIHAVMRDELHCSPRIAALLFRRLSNHRPPTAERCEAPADLTAREWQIAERLVRGLSNKEIAHELAIELSTVKNHVHHLLGKLNAQHRGHAVALLRPLFPAGVT